MPDGPGLVHMTGRIALAYMRTRATGSGGDFARTERQRKVVAQLFDKCRSLSLLELVGLYNEVSSGMKMSLSAMDILSVLSQGYTLMTSGADFCGIPDSSGRHVFLQASVRPPCSTCAGKPTKPVSMRCWITSSDFVLQGAKPC